MQLQLAGGQRAGGSRRPDPAEVFLTGASPFDASAWLRMALEHRAIGYYLTWNPQPGLAYVLISTDLKTWANYGAPRLAAGTSIPCSLAATTPPITASSACVEIAMLRLLRTVVVGWPAGGVGAWGSRFLFLAQSTRAAQVPLIGYNLPGDNNAPKQLGEEYRHNTPVMYYTIDAPFLDYFGSNGIAAIDAAFALSTSCRRPPDLAPTAGVPAGEVPVADFEAAALYCERREKTWRCHCWPRTWGWARRTGGSGACTTAGCRTIRSVPGVNYYVHQAEFRPGAGHLPPALKPTSYINDVLWSYYLVELCNAPLPPQAVCVPFTLDQTAQLRMPVGSLAHGIGTFYTGLTKDDVGDCAIC